MTDPQKHIVFIEEAKLEHAESSCSLMDEAKQGVKEEKVVVNEDIPDELLPYLDTDPGVGLTSEEATKRLLEFGPNRTFIGYKCFYPILLDRMSRLFAAGVDALARIAFLIEVAAILSAVVQDWIDFGIIVALLFINAFIGFFEEYRAESALDALRQTLALKTRAKRDGEWSEVEAKDLVPGDIIVVRIGDIVPADAQLLGLNINGDHIKDGELQIDQSALTGESLPVHKKENEYIYSSSTVKQGHMMARVVHTGGKTFIGRAANLMAITTEPGHFQKIVNHIGNFLVIISIVMVLIIFIVLVVQSHGKDVLSILRDVLVLTVAAIPVGLPTVLSVTMAIGAKQLAKKKVIIKRLTAVEEMASISILCSDKTGTLTLNELSFDEPYLNPEYTKEDILTYAFLASEPGAKDAIENAVQSAARKDVPRLANVPVGNEHDVPGIKVEAFTPFNPTSKMTMATIRDEATGEVYQVAKGAPHVIIHLVGGDAKADKAVRDLASRGLRALGVARTAKGTPMWELVGLISLLDPPRPDSAETIRRCQEMGVAVKMITGDQQVIGIEVARRLGMSRVILDAHKLNDTSVPEEEIVRRCVHADGFAEVIPEHKFRVVQLLQENGSLVGMTGDGVNDAPALKKANVGIAVHGCTDAARSAADIVLLAPGLSTIVDGILTSRAIFQRMRSYALYRITSTVHFLLFFFVIILAERWYLSAILLILITILNDAATIVIAFDNAQISAKPDKWRLGQLIILSLLLGSMLAGLSFAVFYIARDVFHVTEGELHSIMYLNISSAPHFVIFSTRLQGYFWENRPSITFVIAVVGTQIFALILCVFGLLTPAISVGWGFSILGISLLYFVIIDIVKVHVMRRWSFALTAKLWPSPARREKLRLRARQLSRDLRVQRNVAKVRKTITAIRAAKAFQENASMSEVSTAVA